MACISIEVAIFDIYMVTYVVELPSHKLQLMCVLRHKILMWSRPIYMVTYIDDPYTKDLQLMHYDTRYDVWFMWQIGHQEFSCNLTPNDFWRQFCTITHAQIAPPLSLSLLKKHSYDLNLPRLKNKLNRPDDSCRPTGEYYKKGAFCKSIEVNLCTALHKFT